MKIFNRVTVILFGLGLSAHADDFAPLRSIDTAEALTAAHQRVHALQEFVITDPKRVIEIADATSRASIAPVVQAEMETTISTIGDYAVRLDVSQTGISRPNIVHRTVRFGGHEYPAVVYGRRLAQGSKKNIPLHGVLLNGTFVLSENPVREITGEDAQTYGATIDSDLSISGTGVLGEMAGRVYRFASRESMLRKIASIQSEEATIGPTVQRTAAQILELGAANSSSASGASVESTPAATSSTGWTKGNQTALVIRCDFSDFPGDSTYNGITYTADYIQQMMDTQVAPFYLHSSNGLYSLSTTVSQKLYRLPQTGTSYATAGDSNQIMADARAAVGNDYDLATYNRIIVLFPSLTTVAGSQITYGGEGTVSDITTWVNGPFDFRILAHELGHNLGLWHAASWSVTDGDPISPNGIAEEYGDVYDTMGDNFSYVEQADFNVFEKSILGWISGPQITTITGPGTYRVYAFDSANRDNIANEVVGLKIVKNSTKSYFIGLRSNFVTANPLVANGAYTILGYNSVVGTHQTELLDLMTPGNTVTDAALAVGASFSEPTVGWTITTLDSGGTAPNLYLDIQVTAGVTATTTITPTVPVVTVQPADVSTNVSLGTSFSVQASGVGTYQWQLSWDNGNIWTDLSDQTNYTGTHAATLVIPDVSSMNGFMFRCVLTGSTTVMTNAATLTVYSANTGGAAPHMTNISTRCHVGTGAAVGIVGFILNKQTKVVIRGIGPTLSGYGVSAYLAKPVLTLFDSASKKIATNSGWKSDFFQIDSIQKGLTEVGATALTSNDDTVIVTTLPAGGYTAQLSGANSTSGIALIEVYLDRAAGDDGDHFVDLSSRIDVETGAGIAIAGLIVTQPTTVLIRAVGPSLAKYGVNGVLQNPVLKLVDGAGNPLASNTGWKTNDLNSINAATTKTGAIPFTEENDSAIVATLAAGGYTALLSGANGTTGDALIEVYLVQ